MAPENSHPVRVHWYATPPGDCSRCGRKLHPGPVGVTDLHPAGALCDLCLLEAHQDLGMLLLVGCAARELAHLCAEDPDKEDEYMLALMVIASVFDRGASWPRRPLGAEGLLQRIVEKAGRMIPMDWIVKFLDGDPH